MNINLKQVLSIVLAVLGVLMVSTTQLTDLFGPTLAKTIVTIAGLVNSLLASIMAVISSQSGLLKDVQAMPGVDKIVVNAQANQTLSQIAVDPLSKVEATTGAAAAVAKTAQG